MKKLSVDYIRGNLAAIFSEPFVFLSVL